MDNSYKNNNFPNTSQEDLEDIWEINETDSTFPQEMFKVFISHRDQHKEEVSRLKRDLAFAGIAAFVAHDDIEALKVWPDEVLRALQSMDLCLLFVTEDFTKSPWTNQEVGFAYGADIPIVMLKAPSTAVGMPERIQALRYKPETFVLDFIQTLTKKKKFLGNKYNLLISSLIRAFAGSESFASAASHFGYLEHLKSMSKQHVREIIKAYENSYQIRSCYDLVGRGYRQGLLFTKLEEWTDKRWEQECYEVEDEEGRYRTINTLSQVD